MSRLSFTGPRNAGTILSALPFILVSNFAVAQVNPDKPTTLEIMKLPHYCQGQFIPSFRGTPGYTQPNNCGVFMNHFCYGLNFMNRANDVNKSKGYRQGSLRRAREDVDYTTMHMTPGCGIEADVKAADMRLRAMEVFLK